MKGCRDRGCRNVEGVEIGGVGIGVHRDMEGCRDRGCHDMEGVAIWGERMGEVKGWGGIGIWGGCRHGGGVGIEEVLQWGRCRDRGTSGQGDAGISRHGDIMTRGYHDMGISRHGDIATRGCHDMGIS